MRKPSFSEKKNHGLLLSSRATNRIYHEKPAGRRALPSSFPEKDRSSGHKHNGISQQSLQRIPPRCTMQVEELLYSETGASIAKPWAAPQDSRTTRCVGKRIRGDSFPAGKAEIGRLASSASSVLSP